MSDGDDHSKLNRPALPRSGFHAHRVSSAPLQTPVVFTDNEEQRHSVPAMDTPSAMRPKKSDDSRSRAARHPFRAFGERSSTRPYAFRPPEPIDKILRHLAAEERIQPLRIIDRAVYDYLKRIGRLPPESGE